MCNIDVTIQMKVFKRSATSLNSKHEAIRRLHASGFVTQKGKITQWYQTLIERPHEPAL